MRRDSDVNPNAADGDLKIELLRVGPFCHDVDENVVFCSANASRTQRAGIYDLQYMQRDDRTYWFALRLLNPSTLCS